MKKYDPHFCAVKDAKSCNLKCAYYLDMAPEDGLYSANCLDAKDKTEYVSIQAEVEAYKVQLKAKYGVDIP